MKKKIMYAVACVALAVVAGWNYQQNQKDVAMSDLTLENIEALASGEGGSVRCALILEMNVNYHPETF